MSTNPHPITSRHPLHEKYHNDFDKWRKVYEAGETFKEEYLKKFSIREGETAFKSRLEVTPIASQASDAINLLRDSIVQRLKDVKRIGGSESYNQAVAGREGGVDLTGRSMNNFMGNIILTELMVMRFAGIYVDMPRFNPNDLFLSQTGDIRPYIYSFRAEDVLSWAYYSPREASPGKLKCVLVREYRETCDNWGLTSGTEEVYRFMQHTPEGVVIRIIKEILRPNGINSIPGINSTTEKMERDFVVEDEVLLNIPEIPFILLDLGASLMEKAAGHQIALLNLGSSDVSYACNANFPFYVEEGDDQVGGKQHLKTPDQKGTEVTVGTTIGRRYPKGAKQPGFINPSSEPLRASMELQEKLDKEIKQRTRQSLISAASRASTESRNLESENLEAGLAYAATILEDAENDIARMWAFYEKTEIAKIEYPERYRLLQDDERMNNAKSLRDLIDTVPSLRAKKEVAKTIINLLLEGKVDAAELDKMKAEVDRASFITSNFSEVIKAFEVGLADGETASQALGYKKGVYDKAKKQQLERLEAISLAQTKGNAPGVPNQKPKKDEDLQDRPEDGKGSAA